MTSPERRYTSLFIDLDNTLWDTIHDNKKCLEELFVDYQFDRHFASFEAFYALYLPYNERLWERYQNQEIDRRTLLQERMLHVLRPMGIRDTRLAMRLNRDLNERTTRHTTLIPGATELLEHVSRSYRLFVLSNGFHEVQSLKMERAGIARFFRGLILSERVGARKPNPVFFDYALHHTRTRRTEVLMIGDSYAADIAGAHDRACGVPGHLKPPPLGVRAGGRQARADHRAGPRSGPSRSRSGPRPRSANRR